MISDPFALLLFDLFPLAVGFLGSLHCLGMCGPMVLAFTLWHRGIWSQVALNMGRLISYSLLGAAAAGLFEAADIGRWFFHVQGSMTFLGGVLLILLGLVLLKVISLPASLGTLGSDSLLARFFRRFSRSSNPLSRVGLGLCMGLMPCCLSWAMLVTAAATQSPSRGFLTMLSFGLGTLPALVLAGISSTLVSMKVRFLGERATAVTLLGMGALLLLRGAGIL